MTSRAQETIDRGNGEFWNELCGTPLALALGITEASPESLARFDRAYSGLYPYLRRYIPGEDLKGKRVLEIGLGYGTMGQLLAGHGCRYVGLDIAWGPVRMMQYRFTAVASDLQGTSLQGSALALPFADNSFDYVYTIGCLHHTGDLPRAVDEVHRVLSPGGKAVMMLYNRYSFRMLVWAPVKYLKEMLAGRARGLTAREFVRQIYDINVGGEAAPHTELVTRRDVRRLCRAFSSAHVQSENFDTHVLGAGIVLRREWFLSNLARVFGLDLYVEAVK